MDKNNLVAKVVFNPERDTSKAKKAADKLIDIVKQNGWAVKVGGGEHLMYEAWQTVGKYYNCSVGTGDANAVKIGEVDGFSAKAYVIDNKTGVKIGEAEAYCMRDEANWKTKPTFQLASMAQTRAGSRALRQIFGFVVALAGYNPTPAEEMIHETVKAVESVQGVQTETPIEPNNPSELPASDKQWNYIKALWGDKDQDELYGYLEDEFSLAVYKDLTKSQASRIIGKLAMK